MNNSLVHITELAAVALVKDDHNMLLVDLMPRILLDEGRQLLDGGNDDMCFRVSNWRFRIVVLVLEFAAPFSKRSYSFIVW